MNLVLIFALLTLLEATASQRLTPTENQQLQRICGTKPKWSSILNHKLLRKSSNKEKSLSESRNIYGGAPATPQEAPWAVQIQYPDYACSATLISSRHVLTSRHCFELSGYRDRIIEGTNRDCLGHDLVYSGTLALLSVKLANGTMAPGVVRRMIMFNGCKPDTDFSHNDIMAIEFDANVPLSDVAYPVCVANVDHGQGMVGQRIDVYSYGSDAWNFDSHEGIGVLRHGVMQIYHIENNEYMVTDPQLKNALRPGDSGGGAVMEENRQITVYGVTSRAQEMESAGVRVAIYYPNICEKTGICR